MIDVMEEEMADAMQALEDAGAVRRSEKHEYPLDRHDEASRGRAIASLTEKYGYDRAETLVDEAIASLPTHSPGGD